MGCVMVGYKVKADRAAENDFLLQAVFDELKATQPEGLSYASFKLDDGLSFLHIASIETEDGSNPLRATASFQNFIANIRDRCEEAPMATSLFEVASYRFFPET